MKEKKKHKKIKKSWIQNGVIILIAITLYVTGLHKEVIGFAQRGILFTGLMNPDVEEITQTKENSTTLELIKTNLNLKLLDKNGKITSLEDLKGRVIFLNYWATWCPPCIAEMPSINKLHEEMGDDVTFVLLSFDKDFEKAIAYDKRKGYNLPIYKQASNLPTALNSSALPTTYVIDKNGNIALTHKGMADYNTTKFKDFLKSLQ
tara:strand:- start:1598 stop:2212 length:615 start_codon:yes stop_codon:yes gene_type:complete